MATVTKSEGDAGDFPAAAYAYVPDPEKTSTWKLRMWKTPDGGPDASLVGAACAAVGAGFRGQKADIPDGDMDAVKATLRKAWKSANPDRDPDEMPASIAMKARAYAVPRRLGHERKAGGVADFELSEEGEVMVAFARTGVVDYDRDYTFPGAFPAKDVPISAYGHNSWPERGGVLPAGKGRISEVKDLAVLRGGFFVDTTSGRDTYLTVKHLGDLQEWSYGFDVTAKADPPAGVKARRGIKSLDVHEVSPVLLGAGRETGTMAIKGRAFGERKAALDDVYTATSALSAILSLIDSESEEAAEDAADGDESEDVATLSQARDLIAEYIAATAKEVGSPEDLEDIAEEAAERAAAMATMSYGSTPMGGMMARQIEAAIKGELPVGLSFAQASARLLRQSEGFVERAARIAEMRTKAGRALSAARVEKLRSHAAALRTAAKSIEDMVDAATPKSTDGGDDETARKARAALHRDALYAQARLAELTSHSRIH